MIETVEQDPLIRIRHRSPVEVCAGLELQEHGEKFLEITITPSQFLTRLIEHELFRDAVTYLAHAFDKPDAVAWACLSVRAALGEEITEPIAEALHAAETWVNEPGEEACRYAEAAAGALKKDKTGAEFAALAAFWSGESMAPEGLPPVEPPPHLTGIAVACAVTLAATCGPPDKIPERFRAFLGRGILIARTPVNE